VPCGLLVERTYRPFDEDQRWISIIIVQSTDPTAVTVSEASVSPLATLRAHVPMHLPFDERLVTVCMAFGSTEIISKASIDGMVMMSSLEFNDTTAPDSTACTAERKSIHFLIDVSSSMSDQSAPGRIKLDDAKAGMKYVVNSILRKHQDSVALSTFSDVISQIIEESAVDKTSLFREIDAMAATRTTNFYEACAIQLESISKLPEDEGTRFLLVFTDGEDNSCGDFARCSSFIRLDNILKSNGGVCDTHLTRFFVIAVGLRESGLRPLRELTKSGRLTLLSFEKATDIEAAFHVASEEIEKVDQDAGFHRSTGTVSSGNKSVG